MAKKAPKKAPTQPNLFGEVDLVFNTLHTELTIVNEEIEDKHKKIHALEDKIEVLGKRKAEMQKSIKAVEKSRKTDEQGTKKKKTPATQ